VLIAGVGESHAYPSTSLSQKPNMAVVPSLTTAARIAFGMAGITVRDLDLLQIHEGFTWYVMAALEAIGICEVGEGGPFVEAGGIRRDGTLPVNTNGGALSEGHVSGMNHIIEGVRQLRRTLPPERQLPTCEHVGVVIEGNFFDGSTLVLRKGGR
jgi:acetyl-CoA acetyltransferase